MQSQKSLLIPDLGGSASVEIIEVMVSVGDTIEAGQSLLTLESDKATMEVPASAAGTVVEIPVSVGDSAEEGMVFMRVNASENEATSESPLPDDQAISETDHGDNQESAAKSSDTAVTESKRLVVIGAGPGGYTAAFRAADLGLDVTLIEKDPSLGGVCLNVGCIPSKALLHSAQIINESQDMARHGVSFGQPDIDLDALREFKSGVVKKLTTGLSGLAKQRQVKVIQGLAKFTGSHELMVTHEDQSQSLQFEQCIIAVGSRVFELPGLPWEDARIMDSTGALELSDIPEHLLVIGGGIIGLEMATVYRALGSEVTVVELSDQLIPGADPDLIKPLQKKLQQRGVDICLGTKVETLDAQKTQIKAHFSGKNTPKNQAFSRVLVAVGRRPNGDLIDAHKAGVEVDDRGFIAVDTQMRTNQSHIFAIGDLVGQPMLAHKATHEAKVAAEVCAGEKVSFQARVIPSVAYTDPEVAWVGINATEAREQGISIDKSVFPWAASGRALGLDRPEGFTKLIFDPETKQIIGAGIVGPGAGDLIAECALAIEMGCEADDIGLTIHPHPTLGETVGLAAEVFTGAVTDILPPKK